MKVYDLIYFFLLNTTIVRWVLTAKEFSTWVIAFILSVLTCFYMYWKANDMKASYKLKQKQLEDLK